MEIGAVLVLCGCAQTVAPVTADRDGGATEDAPPETSVDAAPRCRYLGPADEPPVDPSEPVAEPHVVELALQGQSFECARMSDDTVRCRGANYDGMLGLGGADRCWHVPAEVPGLRGVAQVVTSGTQQNACARLRDGTVWCWGSDELVGLGSDPESAERCEALTPHRCRTRPTRVPGLDDVVSLMRGRLETCAVRRSGEVWCWGPSPTLVSPVPTGLPVRTRFDDIAEVWPISWNNRLLRDRAGVYRFSEPRTLPGVQVPREADSVSTDGGHFCYRLPDATVRCLGGNDLGQVGSGERTDFALTPIDPGLSGVRSVTAGAYHTCAVLNDGTAQCWGDAQHGALGAPASDRCSFLGRETPCALRPQRVPGVTNIDRMFLGVWSSCAILQDRSVWCWGSLAFSGGEEGPPTRVRW